QDFELAIANERISADNGKVEWPVLVDELKHAVDQLLSFKIREAAEIGRAQMSIFVCVTSGTAQRTLFGDFQGQAGNAANKSSAPRLQNWLDLHLQTTPHLLRLS